MFALFSLIDSSESKRSQNLIKEKIKGEKTNPINLKTQWNKTRDYVGDLQNVGETSDVNSFIDNSSLDSDGDIIMHWCNSKRY